MFLTKAEMWFLRRMLSRIEYIGVGRMSNERVVEIADNYRKIINK